MVVLLVCWRLLLVQVHQRITILGLARILRDTVLVWVSMPHYSCLRLLAWTGLMFGIEFDQIGQICHASRCLWHFVIVRQIPASIGQAVNILFVTALIWWVGINRIWLRTNRGLLRRICCCDASWLPFLSLCLYQFFMLLSHYCDKFNAHYNLALSKPISEKLLNCYLRFIPLKMV